jgi:hypothetical protein
MMMTQVIIQIQATIHTLMINEFDLARVDGKLDDIFRK